jgi:hypothetical protein
MQACVLDLFELKPEFLSANLAAQSIYVRPGELELYARPEQWLYVGRAFHPNHLQATDVQKKGYCLRSLPAGLDWKRIGRSWYDHPSSLRARKAEHTNTR